MWNIISSIYLILPKSLTYLFIAVIYKYHWWDNSYRKWNRKFTWLSLLLLLLHWTTTLTRACITYLTLKFCFTIMTVFLHTVILISSICLGTMLRIELNGLKMNQLFGISRLILRSILILDFIDVSWWCLMLILDTALATQSWEDTRNKSCLFFLYATTHQKGENEFLIYIIFMLNDWRERHPMEVEIPHRVMCGRKKNMNNIPTYIEMLIKLSSNLSLQT